MLRQAQHERAFESSQRTVNKVRRSLPAFTSFGLRAGFYFGSISFYTHNISCEQRILPLVYSRQSFMDIVEKWRIFKL